MPNFDVSSSYKLAENFNFFKVNCAKTKSICTHFGVQKYPTTKIFFNGIEIPEEPGREIESLLETVDKLNSKAIVEINSEEKFRKLYGDISFLIVSDKSETKFLTCLEELAENKFKPYYYFGLISKDNYKKEIDTPVVIVILFYLT